MLTLPINLLFVARAVLRKRLVLSPVLGAQPTFRSLVHSAGEIVRRVARRIASRAASLENPNVVHASPTTV